LELGAGRFCTEVPPIEAFRWQTCWRLRTKVAEVVSVNSYPRPGGIIEIRDRLPTYVPRDVSFHTNLRLPKKLSRTGDGCLAFQPMAPSRGYVVVS